MSHYTQNPPYYLSNYGLTEAQQVDIINCGCNMPTVEYMNWLSYRPCAPSVPSNNATGKDWIDEYLRNNFIFGYKVIDEDSGATSLSLIPSFLINFSIENTPSTSRGWKIGDRFAIPGEKGEWQEYIKIANQRAYQYIRNLSTGEERAGGDWPVGIQDSLISTVDADKILRPCRLMSKVTDPVTPYINQQTGDYNTGVVAAPVVYTETVTTDSNTGVSNTSCKLKTIIRDRDVRKSILPNLATSKGQLWAYNPVTDDAPVFQPDKLDNLTKVSIDGQTIRAFVPGSGVIAGATKGGDGDSIGGSLLQSYTYTDGAYLTGDGTLANPVKIKQVESAGLSLLRSDVIDSTPQSGNLYTTPGLNAWDFKSNGQVLDPNAGNAVIFNVNSNGTTAGEARIPLMRFKLDLPTPNAYIDFDIQYLSYLGGNAPMDLHFSLFRASNDNMTGATPISSRLHFGVDRTKSIRQLQGDGSNNCMDSFPMEDREQKAAGSYWYELRVGLGRTPGNDFYRLYHKSIILRYKVYAGRY